MSAFDAFQYNKRFRRQLNDRKISLHNTTSLQYASLKDNSRSIQKYVLRIFMFAGAIVLPRVCIQTGSSSLLSPKLPICMHDSRRISHLKGLKMQ